MVARKYGPEIRAEIVAAYNSNAKTAAIKEQYGVPHSTILRFVRLAGATMRIERNKRQQVIKLSEAQPRLLPSEIARIIGAHRQYVIRIRQECGFKTIRRFQRPPLKRTSIAVLHERNPELGAVEVALIVGCKFSYAKKVLCSLKKKNVAPVVAATTNEGGLQGLSM